MILHLPLWRCTRTVPVPVSVRIAPPMHALFPPDVGRTNHCDVTDGRRPTKQLRTPDGVDYSTTLVRALPQSALQDLTCRGQAAPDSRSSSACHLSRHKGVACVPGAERPRFPLHTYTVEEGDEGTDWKKEIMR